MENTDVFLDQVWKDTWDRLKTRQIDATGQETASWRAGGRATKDNPNKENENWWLPNGREMLNRWANFRANSGWKMWVTPEGKPAIELGLNIELGGVPIKMALDRVMITPDGEMAVLDLKTGSRTPSSDLQLGIYAVGMEVAFGIRPTVGAYWMARDGMTSALVDLSKWTVEKVTDIVVQFETARKNGIFIPNFDHCKMCSITEQCKYMNGEK